MSKHRAAFGTDLQPAQLCKELQKGTASDVRRRRAVVGLSVFGMASMAAVTLLQTGVLEHLPDPPLDSFDSGKVNSSDTAYQLGTPDGAVSLAGLAMSVPIAGFGGVDRAQRTPYVPIAARIKSGVEAIAASWYFYQMPTKEKKWCTYCIAGAFANFGIFALTIPGALKALAAIRAK
ncbi:MAG: vitamin K epoxide reductase family protein [Acidobacteriota bacterium]|nr:vitamin K epoxide reductase family protein [Acidobacteriota bacterium]